MPFKTWAVGEEVLASDFNPYLQRQVVATFPNAAGRTAGIAAPDPGMVTYLVDTKVLEVWDGTAWRPVRGGVPLGAGQSAMAGTYTGQPVQMRGWQEYVTTDAGGYYASAFPAPVNGVLSVHAQLVTPYAVTTNITAVSVNSINGIVFQTASNNPSVGPIWAAFLALVW